MPRSYFPSRQAELVEWGRNFTSLISPSPTTYGLTQAQVDAFVLAFETFEGAYQTAEDMSTRTPGNIAIKRQKMADFKRTARGIVGIIQSVTTTTDAMRRELRITVRDTDPTPIGPPEEMPVLRVAAVRGRVLDLELRREDGTTRRKPAGVGSAWLYAHVGDNPPGDLKQWSFKGGSTLSNPQIVFAAEVTPGTAVWVTALWVNPTSQPGPACAPVKVHINYEGLNEAA